MDELFIILLCALGSPLLFIIGSFIFFIRKMRPNFLIFLTDWLEEGNGIRFRNFVMILGVITILIPCGILVYLIF